MDTVLFGRYFSLLELLVNLLLVCGVVGIAVYLGMRRRLHVKLGALEQKLAEAQSIPDPKQLQTLLNDLESAVAHDFVKRLDHISDYAEKTLDGLGKNQIALRDRQAHIIVAASELTHHAANMLEVFRPESDELETELVDVVELVELVLEEFYTYAASKGVRLIPPQNSSVEPTPLNRSLTLLVLRNLIHNAIHYTDKGGVVKVSVDLAVDANNSTKKAIHVDVKDTGRGISEEDQARLFEWRNRGERLIEQGSGLGLFCARRAARRQGGDVILADRLNNGSTFRAIFPYRGIQEVPE